MKRRRLITASILAALAVWGLVELAHGLGPDEETVRRRAGTAFRALDRCLVGDVASSDEALARHVERLVAIVPPSHGWPKRCGEHLTALEVALVEGALDERQTARLALAGAWSALAVRDPEELVEAIRGLRHAFGAFPHDDVSGVPGPDPGLPLVRLSKTPVLARSVPRLSIAPQASGPIRFRSGRAGCWLDPSEATPVLACRYPPDAVPAAEPFGHLAVAGTADAPMTAIDWIEEGSIAFDVESGRLLPAIDREVRGAFREPHRLRLLARKGKNHFLMELFEDVIEESEVEGLTEPWLVERELFSVADRGGIQHLVVVPVIEGPAIGHGDDLGSLEGWPELYRTEVCATSELRFFAIPMRDSPVVTLVVHDRQGYARLPDIRGERFLLSCDDETLRIVLQGEGTGLEQRCTQRGCKPLPIALPPDEEVFAVGPHGRDDIVVLSGRPFTAVRIAPGQAVGSAPIQGYLEAEPLAPIDAIRLFSRPGGTFALIDWMGRASALKIAPGDLSPIPVIWNDATPPTSR